MPRARLRYPAEKCSWVPWLAKVQTGQAVEKEVDVPVRLASALDKALESGALAKALADVVEKDIGSRLASALHRALVSNELAEAVAVVVAERAKRIELPPPRGPVVGNRVVVLSSRWTRRCMPKAIGKEFVICVKAEGHQPYKLEGYEHVWLSEADFEPAVVLSDMAAHEDAESCMEDADSCLEETDNFQDAES